jgi:hypothetical protein
LEETAVNLPEVFVVARFTNEALHLIGRTVDALKATVGAQWSAVFITDNSEDAAFRNACANAFQDDKRFLTQPSREKLEGRIILLLEAGAIPRSHGIRLMAAPMVCNPDLALIYSDEDRISRAGLPELPWFKPEYSPLLAAQGMLFGRMLALRADSTCSRSTADAILDPSRSVLQIAIELTRELPSKRIGHVAHVLFHDVVPPMHPHPAPRDAPGCQHIHPDARSLAFVGPHVLKVCDVLTGQWIDSKSSSSTTDRRTPRLWST